MTILIKGMEMPEAGQEIIIAENWDGTIYARLEPSEGGWCPVVEVSTPHGRLIDADGFIVDECQSCDGCCEIIECNCLNCKSEHRCDFMQDIINAPTIIEAEE